MWKRLFGQQDDAGAGRRPERAPPEASHSPVSTLVSGGDGTTLQGGAPRAVHKEVVRISMRDTLQAAGIPAAWLRVEPLSMSMPDRDTGVHARIVVRHWDARLMHYAPAIQQALEQRILTLDPAAHGWLLGCSWQFALRSGVPPGLPPVEMWGTHGTAAAAEPSGHVISGPTRFEPQDAAIVTAQAAEDTPSTRAELERLLAERDAEFAKSPPDFQATQPLKL